MFEEIENKTNIILEKFGFNYAPIPIKKIIKSLGVEVKPEYLGNEISGVLVIENGRSIIGYNDSEPNVRQRFTLAHELGHHILHKTDLTSDRLFVDKMYRRNEILSKREKNQEREANVFASRILMPENLIKKEFNEIVNSLDLLTDEDIVKKMASKFKVSTISMTWRLSNLNLIENKIY